MPSVLRAARVLAVALLVMAIDVPLAVHVGAQAVPPLQGSQGTSSSPSPTPTSTPCPTDLTGAFCNFQAPGSTPTPTPSPTPQPTSSGSGSQSGSGAPAGGAAPPPPPSGGSPSGAGAGAAPAPPPGPTPSAMAMSHIAATFKNAPFLGQLLNILNHPISAQRPDLRHFRPVAAAGGVDAGGPGGPAGRALAVAKAKRATGLAVGVAVLGMLVAMLAALLVGSTAARPELRRGLSRLWRMHPSMHRIGVAVHNAGSVARAVRRHLGIPRFAMRRHNPRGLAIASGVAALPAVLVATVLAAAPGATSGALARSSSAPTSSYLRSEMALDLAVPVGQTVQQPPTWTRLVTIERGLAGQQDELTAQEAAITRLAVNVAGQPADDDGPVVVGPSSPSQLRNQLSLLVAAHSATQTAYQASLQAEYDLYRAAAQDPAQRDQLSAAAAAAQPGAKDAVTYNLSLIQTQLAQEGQIAAAEGQLAQIGSLGQAQLDAMRHHQPFIAPLLAPVTQVFGPTDFSLEPPLTYNGTFYPHFHTGLDLGAPLDTPVHAAADGVVLLAAASVDQNGQLVGYGNYVVVAHPDGFVTLYGHLDSIAVKAGQVVHQGEIVGQEGSTGWSTGPHVHFEIRHNGQFLDPAPFLAGQLPPS